VLLGCLLSFASVPWAWDAERLSRAAAGHGARASAALRALQPLLAASPDPDERHRLQAINEFFNRRVQFRDDLEVWGQVDFWASPFEMLEKGAGDCEDFAVAKYFSLISAGMAAQKLRLVYVRAQMGGPGGALQAHMVLAYYAPGASQPQLLDSLRDSIEPASARRDLLPVYAFNAEGLYVPGKKSGDSKKLSRWQDVLKKMREEGFAVGEG